MTVVNPDWTYGEEGLAFPVKRGQVWQVTTNHVYTCSDLMASKIFEQALARVRTPTLLYSDPPWNQSNVNGFRTKAGLEAAEHTYLDLYQAIISFGSRYSIPMWIEGGNRERSKVLDLLPGPVKTAYSIMYYRTHPCSLLYSGMETSRVPGDLLKGKEDDYTPGIVMEHYPQGVVIDPCAGQGLTAIEAQRHGWSSATNELHPQRMSCALYRMRELTGVEPKQIA